MILLNVLYVLNTFKDAYTDIHTPFPYTDRTEGQDVARGMRMKQRGKGKDAARAGQVYGVYIYDFAGENHASNYNMNMNSFYSNYTT